MNATYQENKSTVLPVNHLCDVFKYDPETGFIFWSKPRKGILKNGVAGTITKRGYVSVMVDGKKLYRHRIAWALTHGEFPHCPIDHINGIKGDDRIENLRLATYSQNGYNRGKTSHNKTGFKGVHVVKRSGKFRSRITVNKEVFTLGVFDTSEDAAEAYQKAAKTMHGDFAPS